MAPRHQNKRDGHVVIDATVLEFERPLVVFDRKVQGIVETLSPEPLHEAVWGGGLVFLVLADFNPKHQICGEYTFPSLRSGR